nr:hypothetical protein [Escherichia coli]
MMTSFFLITRTLDSQSYSYINTEIFGDVEIRSANHDLDVERELLKKAEGSSFAGRLNTSDYDFSNRMSTIVEAEDEIEAIQLAKEGANKQVISSQADSLIKISRIWADFFPANTSNQPI